MYICTLYMYRYLSCVENLPIPIKTGFFGNLSYTCTTKFSMSLILSHVRNNVAFSKLTNLLSVKYGL